MEKFKVGDKVIAKKGAPYNITTDGCTGDVIEIDEEGYFDEDCTLKVNEKSAPSGYWVNPKYFDLLEQPKIVITTDGKTTLARLYDGKKVSKIATAVCSPDDTFDFMTGAKIAFERLTAKKENNEIKIGDRVKVVDSGECYSSYKGWIKKNAYEYACLWAYNISIHAIYNTDQLRDDYPKFRVVAKAPHAESDEMLYLIKDFTGRCFLIGEKGIKKIEVE